MMLVHGTPQLVHVNDATGKRVYNYLLDDGGPILNFTKADDSRSSIGFLRRDDLVRYGWQVVSADAPLCPAICTAPDPGHRPGSCHDRCIFTAAEPHQHRCETHKQER